MTHLPLWALCALTAGGYLAAVGFIWAFVRGGTRKPDPDH